MGSQGPKASSHVQLTDQTTWMCWAQVIYRFGHALAHIMKEVRINICAHRCLKPLLNQLKAVFRQLKPCSNHGIHMLFEHVFTLKSSTEANIVYVMSTDSARLPRNKHFLHQHHYICRGMMSKRAKNKLASTDVYSALKATFSCFFRHFRQEFSWNHKNARITIPHVYFSALTFAGSLGISLNTRPSGLLFKQLPQDPANVNV